MQFFCFTRFGNEKVQKKDKNTLKTLSAFSGKNKFECYAE